MPDSRQKYKARFKFANSDINTQAITKTKVKRELQNWAWQNTQDLSHANLCAGLTSGLILADSLDASAWVESAFLLQHANM